MPLNMINSAAAAYAEKSPLVVLSGGPGRANRTPGCCCTIRPGARFAILPDLQRDHLRPCTRLDAYPRGHPAGLSPGCWAIVSSIRGRSTSNCRATWSACPAGRAGARDEVVDADALAAYAEVLARLRNRKRVMMVDVEIRRFRAGGQRPPNLLHAAWNYR